MGKIVSLSIGASGSVGIDAEQRTRSVENMQFNSLNEVASKFIDVADGDTEKYAELVSNFDEHMRNLRAENTSSNTGITSNINNTADDLIDQEVEDGKGKTLTKRGYR